MEELRPEEKLDCKQNLIVEVPTQLLTCLILLLAAQLTISPDMNLGVFSMVYFLLVLGAATQDSKTTLTRPVAVDGWALTLLPRHQNYASTAQVTLS